MKVGHYRILKVLFVLLFFFFLVALLGMWDLSSPTEIEPMPPLWGLRILTSEQPGKSHWSFRRQKSLRCLFIPCGVMRSFSSTSVNKKQIYHK